MYSGPLVNSQHWSGVSGHVKGTSCKKGAVSLTLVNFSANRTLVRGQVYSIFPFFCKDRDLGHVNQNKMRVDDLGTLASRRVP